jgi:hypothetical protein
MGGVLIRFLDFADLILSRGLNLAARDYGDVVGV